MQRTIVALLVVVCLAACENGGKPGTGSSGVSGGGYPYGKPVPGKPGLVYSPYSEKEVYIDVRGFDRGTEVRDPWTGKIFLVP